MDIYRNIFDFLDDDSSDWYKASSDDEDEGPNAVPPPDLSPPSPSLPPTAGPSNLEASVEHSEDPPVKKRGNTV